MEESNLQRQSLFDEDDAARGLPKAAAAETKLKRINSEVDVRGVVADLSADNAEERIKGADLVLDGTDNFETRFLVNDLCIREGIPGLWSVRRLLRPRAPGRPHLTPCLRCVLEGDAAAGLGPTCEPQGGGSHRPCDRRYSGGRGAQAVAGRIADLLPGIVTVDSGRSVRGDGPPWPSAVVPSYGGTIR